MPTPSEILSLPSGAQWVKADLHVHTPASADIDDKWKDATPEDVVRIAAEKGLDLIAITDHNTAVWCDPVRAAANGTGLTVLPGVEISTPQGHLLALFDTAVSSADIEDFLVTIGIARSQFGSLDVATNGGIVEVAAAISKAGGVAIAAHAEANKGFMKVIQVGYERERAYVTPDLWAMEILDIETRPDHQAGKRYSRRMTCIQSSDCWPAGADHHELDGMGNRHTFFKLDERTLDGLKLALIDPDIRVRLAEDEFPSPANSIVGMWVTGGFLNGQAIRFSENVSCFIGDTGSGKSVATELLRFGLDQPPVVPKIRSEVDSLLKQQLGDLGTVHILFKKGGSYYLAERVWSSAPEKPITRRVVGEELQPVDGLDVPAFFPIKCFSQSEIIEFAREPDVRLSLTDDLIDRTTESTRIADAKNRLQENASSIIAEQTKETNIREQLAARAALAEEIANIDKVLNDSRVEQQRLWYNEQSLFDQAKNQTADLCEKIDVSIDQLTLASPCPDDLTDMPNQDVLEKLKRSFGQWTAGLTQTRIQMTANLDVLKTDLGTLRGEWDSRFEIAEEAYQQLLAELDEGGIVLHTLSEQRRVKQEQMAALDGVERELQEDVLPRIRDLIVERDSLLDDLQSNRRSITEKRNIKSKELSAQLDHQVRLQVHGRANKANFNQRLHDIASGSRLYGTDLTAMAQKCHPVPFVKQMLANGFDELSEQTGLESVKFHRLWDTIVDRDRLHELYELQLADVEDVIEVQLRVDQGQYRNLEELSHGQKCMVVLMVALAEGDFPLIVDQPEDALHAPSIETGIVSSLRSGRGTRQCLFATRNANILVSADAEQIIALKADAQHGQVDGTGSLDRFSHRQLIIYHVEGGEEAFQRRKMMYTLEPSV